MGGAASINNLPEVLTEEMCKSICGDYFDPAIFDTHKNAEGTVDRDSFLKEYSAEKEARRVFLAYCPTGTMDSRTYIKLCRETKMLNKKFSSGDADLVFTHVSHKHPNFTYTVFRHHALVEIAAKKEVDVKTLVKKLEVHDGPVLHATHADQVRFHDDQSTYTGAVAQNQNFKNDLNQAGHPENQAALKLQSRERVRIAKKQTDGLREVYE